MGAEIAEGLARTRRYRCIFIAVGAIAIVCVTGVYLWISPSPLPTEVAHALNSPDTATLYSLEPSERPTQNDRTLQGFKIIGQTSLDRGSTKAVVAEFTAAIKNGGGLTLCFDPRHALSVTSGGTAYDLVLCYECGVLKVFTKGRLIATFNAGGSAEKLNAILSANNVPLSRSGVRLEAAKRQFEIAQSQWIAATPTSLRPFWPDIQKGGKVNLDPLRNALLTEFPDEQTRILVVYAWFGSGMGPWSGFPGYEEVAEDLLLDYTTEALVAAAAAARTPQQLEGAARLFGGWTFSQRRRADLVRLSPDLKQRLLARALESNDEDKRSRAHHAFD
jgi:hypothetical protein